jgi:PST family polysaccharide transporter/lipopolysaccharide exporter
MSASPAEDQHGSRVRAGVKWVTLSLILARIVQFLTNVVLAWLLVPEMFGVVAMASAVINVLAAVREMGLDQAYIQRQDRDEEESRRAADTTFVLSLGVNLALFVVAFALAPWMARFFDDAVGLESVLRWMFLAFPLNALLTTPGIVLQKRLEFRKFSLAEIVGVAANGAIAISLAFLGFGVWSLVAGHLGSRLAQGWALVRLSGWRPRLRFDRPIARQLFAYGKYMWGFAALSAVGGMADRLVLGHVFGAAAVGAYHLAFNLCNNASQIAVLVNRIAFPALSRVQHDRELMRRAFLKALSHVSILSFPIAFGLLAVASDFVLSVYGGRKWEAAIPVVEVLAFYGMTLAVSAVAGPVLKAIGKPQVLLYTSIQHHALLFPLLFVLGGRGAVGIAWAVLIPLLSSSAIAFVLVVLYLDLRPWRVLEPLVRSGVPALLMYVAVVLLRRELVDLGLERPALLAVEVAFGALVYLAGTLVLNRELLREFAVTVRQVMRAKGERIETSKR